MRLTSLLLALIACGARSEPRPPAHADLVLRGGVILTMDPERPVAAALAAADGRIVSVGADEDVATLVGPHTEVIALAGRAVVPGFIDAHTHFGSGFPAHAVFLWDPTRDALLARLRAEVAVEPDQPLALVGWFPIHVRGTRADLDAVSATRPIFVSAGDGHTDWLNGAALRWLGVGDPSVDQPSLPLDRDARGEPTGIFPDPPVWGNWIARRAAALSSERDVVGMLAAELRAASAAGITGCSNMSFSPRTAAMFDAMAARGELPVRVREYAFGHDPRGLAAMRAIRPARPDLFRVVGVKYFLDGAPISGNGSYDGVAVAGPVQMAPAAIADAVRDHTHRGEQVAFHASGQRAVRAALDAVAGVPGAAAARVRLEHADAIHAEDEARLSRLGVVLSMQPGHWPTTMGLTLDPRAIPPMEAWGFARHVRRGVPVSLGSDGTGPPLATIGGAMIGPTPAEALSFEEALAAHTRVAAFAARDEGDVGVLAVGRAADLVILSRDPRGLSPREVMALTVERTVVGGRTTFSAPAH